MMPRHPWDEPLSIAEAKAQAILTHHDLEDLPLAEDGVHGTYSAYAGGPAMYCDNVVADGNVLLDIKGDVSRAFGVIQTTVATHFAHLLDDCLVRLMPTRRGCFVRIILPTWVGSTYPHSAQDAGRAMLVFVRALREAGFLAEGEVA